MSDFDVMSLFDFFEEETSVSEEKEEAEAVVTEEESTDVDSEVEEADDENETLSVEDGTENSSSSASKTSSGKKIGKASKKKTEKKYLFPVTVHGRNFCVTLEREDGDMNDISIEELFKRLYNMGYKEVAHKDVNPIEEGSLYHVYISSPTSSTPEMNQAGFSSKVNKLLICDGMEQMELTTADFPGMEPDEISVADCIEKFENSFAKYVGLSLNVDFEAMVAVPVFTDSLLDGDSVNLPATVMVEGNKVDLDENSFILEGGKATGKDVIKVVCGDEIASDLVKLKSNESGTYFVHYEGKTTKISKEHFAVEGSKSKTDEVVIRMELPLSVYFVTINQTFTLTKEMFNGKDKVTENDVISYLSKDFRLLKSRDRQIDTFYAKSNNLLSIALSSGKKGAALAASSLLDAGNLSLDEASKRESFFGYVEEKDSLFRVEANPVGTYIGKVVNGDIAELSFKYRLPLIPYSILKEIAEDFFAHLDIERIAQIAYNHNTGEYFIHYPNRTKESKALIEYVFDPLPTYCSLVMTIHSHNTFPPVFSSTDNNDEAITGLYGVLGSFKEDGDYSACFRAGMEGVFSYMSPDKLFIRR